MQMSVQANGVEALADRLRRAPRVTADLIEKNLRGLGKVVAGKMRLELRPVRFTGETERSVSTEYEAAPPVYSITIGPTAKQAAVVRTGSKPHYPPIAPLKRWAAWKLGDESAAYAIQKAIGKRGTSRWLESKGLGERVQGFGIGLNFPDRTLARGDVRTAVSRTSERIALDLVDAFEKGA